MELMKALKQHFRRDCGRELPYSAKRRGVFQIASVCTKIFDHLSAQVSVHTEKLSHTGAASDAHFAPSTNAVLMPQQKWRAGVSVPANISFHSPANVLPARFHSGINIVCLVM